MSQELLYTSAPRGLKAGSRGFCTVVSTPAMSAPLAAVLESISGYRHVFPPGDPRAAENPVAWSHVKLQAAGKSYRVVSRVADYGLDYSERTNKLAHHVVLDPGEAPAGGPAWLLEQSSFMDSAWDGEPKILPGGRPVPSGDIRPGICAVWQALTGDAGWAGVLAESFLKDPERQVYIVFEPGMDLLRLLVEAISLLPAESRWNVTFSTYYSNLPPSVQCQWRCVLAGSPEANQSRRFVQALRIDLTVPMPAATGGELVEAARTGRRVSRPSVAPAPPPAVEPAQQWSDDELLEELQPLSPSDNQASPPRKATTNPETLGETYTLQPARSPGAQLTLPPAITSSSSRQRHSRKLAGWWIAVISALSILLAVGIAATVIKFRNSEIHLSEAIANLFRQSQMPNKEGKAILPAENQETNPKLAEASIAGSQPPTKSGSTQTPSSSNSTTTAELHNPSNRIAALNSDGSIDSMKKNNVVPGRDTSGSSEVLPSAPMKSADANKKGGDPDSSSIAQKGTDSAQKTTVTGEPSLVVQYRGTKLHTKEEVLDTYFANITISTSTKTADNQIDFILPNSKVQGWHLHAPNGLEIAYKVKEFESDSKRICSLHKSQNKAMVASIEQDKTGITLPGRLNLKIIGQDPTALTAIKWCAVSVKFSTLPKPILVVLGANPNSNQNSKTEKSEFDDNKSSQSRPQYVRSKWGFEYYGGVTPKLILERVSYQVKGIEEPFALSSLIPMQFGDGQAGSNHVSLSSNKFEAYTLKDLPKPVQMFCVLEKDQLSVQLPANSRTSLDAEIKKRVMLEWLDPKKLSQMSNAMKFGSQLHNWNNFRWAAFDDPTDSRDLEKEVASVLVELKTRLETAEGDLLKASADRKRLPKASRIPAEQDLIKRAEESENRHAVNVQRIKQLQIIVRDASQYVINTRAAYKRVALGSVTSAAIFYTFNLPGEDVRRIYLLRY